MNIKVEIDIKGLDQLTESLALLGSALAYKNNMVETAEEAVDLIDEVKTKKPKEEEDKKEVKKPEEDKKEVKKPKEKAVEKPKEKTKKKVEEKVKSEFTREDVRSAFVSKNSPDTRDKLKAILDKFETANITELEEKHFEDAMKELEAI